MTLPEKMTFGIFLGPFHRLGENPTLALERDLELIQWLDYLGFDEAWIGEHHSGGWETIGSPELFIATAAERTKNINLGTGVISLPYHHPLMVTNRMVLLDHLTKGRVMMGVGPGALVSDAMMLGIDPSKQRQRMDESLGIIMRLLTEVKPITVESEWFTLHNAIAHLRPYSKPHFQIAVAAGQSPSGMVLAGKHGAHVLSLGTISKDTYTKNLDDYWKIAEQSAQEHGKTVKRKNWRLVRIVHLAESRKEAIEQARKGASYFQRDYFENTMGFDRAVDVPANQIVDAMNDNGSWCIGTPDDLIASINQLSEESGGFGGLLVLGGEFANREQIRRSYELIARYVMPKFQGSLESLESSQSWLAEHRHEFMASRNVAVKKAGKEHSQKSKPV